MYFVKDLFAFIGLISLIVLVCQKNKFFSSLSPIQKCCFILLGISVSVPALIDFFNGFAHGFWESL